MIHVMSSRGGKRSFASCDEYWSNNFIIAKKKNKYKTCFCSGG